MEEEEEIPTISTDIFINADKIRINQVLAIATNSKLNLINLFRRLLSSLELPAYAYSTS
jgi:hypothetical protein